MLHPRPCPRPGCKSFGRLCSPPAIASGRANAKGSPLQHPAIRFPSPVNGVPNLRSSVLLENLLFCSDEGRCAAERGGGRSLPRPDRSAPAQLGDLGNDKLLVAPSPCPSIAPSPCPPVSLSPFPLSPQCFTSAIAGVLATMAVQHRRAASWLRCRSSTRQSGSQLRHRANSSVFCAGGAFPTRMPWDALIAR